MTGSPPLDTSQAVAEIGDLRVPISGGNFVSSINDLDRAWFSIEMSDDLRLEYLAPVKVEIDGHSMIEGSILAAFPYGTSVELHIQSAVALTEETMHGLVAQDFPHQDLVYAAVRQAGFDDDDIVIHELDQLPREVFETVVGVDDLVVGSHSTRIGSVTFVPPQMGRTILDQFSPYPEWAEELESAPSHAVVYTSSTSMYNAQTEALSEIDTALSWLATRTRYGHSHLPNGTLHRYERNESNASPARRDLVALRGMMTGRRWIQKLGPRQRAAPLKLGGRSRLRDPILPRSVPLYLRQAMFSAQRALVTEDPIQRSQALWEAMEFYLSGRDKEPLFSSSERAEMLKCLRKAVPKKHHQRVADLVEMVDQPPPRAALRKAIDDEGVPITDSEFRLLSKVRKARNKGTHGAKKIEIPTNDELDLACSILSRILVHRVQGLESGRSQSFQSLAHA